MSNFETTALELAAKSTECLSQIDDLNASLDRLAESVDGGIEALDSQFNALQEIVKTALEALNTLENELAARLDKFGIGCSKTNEMINTIRSSYEEHYESAINRTEESNSQIKAIESEQSQSWESISSRATTLLEGYSNIQIYLATVTSVLTGEISSQVGTMLTEIPSRLQEESTAFSEYVEVEKISAMMEEASDLTSKIEDIGSSIKDALQDLASLMEDGITDSLQSMYGAYEDTLSDLIDTATDLVDTFNDISDRIPDSAESVAATFDMIDDVSEKANVGLGSALKVFNEAKELLERIV